MADDFDPHFPFEELVVTNNAELQQANKDAAESYRPTLGALSRLLGRIRGDQPLVVNSAFRSDALNKKTPGSSPTSQHPMGQAADFHRPGEDVGETFKAVLARLKAEKIPFGQLIDESAKRGYGVARWVHISLGADFWKPERCGEVLRKWDDADGIPHYELLEKVPQQEVAS